MIRINLLPFRELEKQAQLRQQLYLFAAILATVLMGMSLLWVVDMRSITALESEKQGLQAELERLKPIVTQVNTLEQREKLLHARLSTIQRLRGNQRGPVRVLDELSQNLPEQAWLNAIDEKTGVYNVSGYALTNFAVADLLRNLQRSGEFTGVDLVSSEQVVVGEQMIKKFIIQFQRAGRTNTVDSPAPAGQRKPGA